MSRFVSKNNEKMIFASLLYCPHRIMRMVGEGVSYGWLLEFLLGGTCIFSQDVCFRGSGVESKRWLWWWVVVAVVVVVAVLVGVALYVETNSHMFTHVAAVLTRVVVISHDPTSWACASNRNRILAPWPERVREKCRCRSMGFRRLLEDGNAERDMLQIFSWPASHGAVSAQAGYRFAFQADTAS